MSLPPHDHVAVEYEPQWQHNPNAELRDAYDNRLVFESQRPDGQWYVEKGVLHCKTPYGSTLQVGITKDENGVNVWDPQALIKLINDRIGVADSHISGEGLADRLPTLNGVILNEVQGRRSTHFEYNKLGDNDLSFRKICNGEFKAIGLPYRQDVDEVGGAIFTTAPEKGKSPAR